MRPLDLEAIEARCEMATKGPWWAQTGIIHAPAWWSDAEPGSACHPADCFNGNGLDWYSDAEFVAHARTDVPMLVAEVKRLQMLLVTLVTSELAGLLERLAEWADEAVIDGGYCWGEDMGTTRYEADDPEHKNDAKTARALAARIRKACLRRQALPACGRQGGDRMTIKTYFMMNARIVAILRQGSDPMALYAAQRIEELERIAGIRYEWFLSEIEAGLRELEKELEKCQKRGWNACSADNSRVEGQE